MIALENILEDLVSQMDDTPVGKPVFYWGTSEDLPQFIKRYDRSSTPLIWLVSGFDVYQDHLSYREAEICFCATETRTDTLNITRVKENYSYQTVLLPLFEQFKRAVELSPNIWIDEYDKLSILKSPNHSVNGQNEAQDIWDVLKVKTKIYFNEKYEC